MKIKKGRLYLETNIRRSSLKHQIMAEIRQSIFRGELMPNDKVTEMQFSEFFGVSRGPVREAMQLLVMEGLLVTTTYKETRVASITPKEVTELLVPIRVNIEVFALKNAYSSWDKEIFERFEEILHQMQRAETFNDTQLFSELDQRFHELIIRSSDMINIENIWNSVSNRIQLLFVYQNNQSMNLQSFIKSHRELIDVFKSEKLDKSVQKLQDHIIKSNTPKNSFIEKK